MEKICITGPSMDDREALISAVESEIEQFEKLFLSQGQEGLVLPEKALIRTYLLAKLSKKID